MIKYVKRVVRQGWQDPRNLFFLLAALGILLCLPLAIHFGGDLYAWMVQENKPEIRFMDYFPHLTDAADPSHLYHHIARGDTGSYAPVFPPLAYGLYYLLYRLTYLRGGIPEGMETEAIPGALSIFTMYLIFNAVLFFVAIEITGQKNRKKDLLLFALLMLSVVFMGSGYMLGNSVMLVLSLLIIGLHLAESSRPLHRELGLVVLALCVGLKLYPAVFGLVFLKEKRYKDLAHLILYSLLLVLLPFAFFGGLDGIQAWLNNLTGPLQSTGLYGRPQFLKGLFFTLIKIITGQDAATFSGILALVVMILWVILAWQSKSKWRTLFFLCCVMIFYPSGAYRYTLAYLAIPLITLLNEPSVKKVNFWPEGIVSAFFGLLFTIPVWWLLVVPMDRRFDLPILTGVEIYLYLVAYALIMAVTISELDTPLRFHSGTQRVNHLPRKKNASEGRA